MENRLPFEYIKRDVLLRKEAKTDEKLGKYPDKRSVEDLINYGIVNIDKPKGPTSHQVSDFVQKILKINKAGHSGTLDPAVTGVLPIALARATRIVQTLLKAGKEYIAIMHLHKKIKEKKLKKICKKFVGKIKQKPPLKSAVKRQLRAREVYYLDLLEIDGQDVLIRVGCEAGTYIRKLCLHPQTEILTKNGIMVASDFYSNHPTIFSFNNGKMIEKNPLATQKLHSPTKLVEITMSSGIRFVVTPNHELFASREEGYEMVEAQTLKEGDYLVKSLTFPDDSKDIIIADLLDDDYLLPQEDIKNKCKQAFISKYGSIRAMYSKLKLDRKAFLSKSNYAITIRHLKLAGIYEQVKRDINTFKTQKGTIIKLKSLNEDFFYLLGLIASDGNNTKEKGTVRYTRVKFHNRNKTLICSFLNTYQKLFPNIPISKKEIREGLFQLDTTNSFLATIAASLGIKSPQKDSDLLPILNAHPKLIRAFLKGYFNGDGSAYFKKKDNILGNYSRIVFHTVSYLDAIRLHKMLLKVKIPNKIIRKRVSGYKKNYNMYNVSVESLSGKRKFIEDIGTNHPSKLEKFKEILTITKDSNINDHYYIGLHYKKEIKKNKSKLYKMGGNLFRILKLKIPITRGFYKKASTMVKLPKLDDFIIEKIKSIKEVKGIGYVYDMTVPETHNFLIETGFVSSNCHDIGKKLGIGAHMSELRRTKAGPFDETTSITLQDLSDAYHIYKKENNEKYIRKVIQPIENAVKHLPKIWVFDTTVNSLCHGSDLKVPGISKVENQIEENDLVAVMTLKDELICLGTSKMKSKEMLGKRGVALKTEKVFMLPETYKLKI